MTDPAPLVYLVDDDDDVRAALTRSLSKRGFQIEAFADAKEFLNAFDKTRQSCLILDYGLPEMDGLALQEKLIADEVILPIIFITGHGGIPESVRAMQAGAMDFLEKPFPLDLLMERVQSALAMSLQLQDEQRQRQKLDLKLADLTARERDVLDHILTNPARVSSKEIGAALEISPRTVDIHRARLMQKMGVKSLLELVQLCMVP